MEPAREDEKISKRKAIELYKRNFVEDFEIGKFSGLAKIHKFLFEGISLKGIDASYYCERYNIFKLEDLWGMISYD